MSEPVNSKKLFQHAWELCVTQVQKEAKKGKDMTDRLYFFAGGL